MCILFIFSSFQVFHLTDLKIEMIILNRPINLHKYHMKLEDSNHKWVSQYNKVIKWVSLGLRLLNLFSPFDRFIKQLVSIHL